MTIVGIRRDRTKGPAREYIEKSVTPFIGWRVNDKWFDLEGVVSYTQPGKEIRVRYSRKTHNVLEIVVYKYPLREYTPGKFRHSVTNTLLHRDGRGVANKRQRLIGYLVNWERYFEKE